MNANLNRLRILRPAIAKARRVRAAIARGSSLPLGSVSFAVGRPGLGGFVDSIDVDPSGIIRVIGWCKGAFNPQQVPPVSLDGRPVPFLQYFRFRREQLSRIPGTILFGQPGLALDYLVPESMLGPSKILELEFEDKTKLRFETDLHFIDPNYRALLSTGDVFHREHIYGSGPPNTAVHPEVLDVARELPGPLLDFGCGRGALIGELQRAGIEAYGLELDSPIIRQSIPSQLTGAITLYDGSFPTPFADARFRSVMCSEVLEHIPDYAAAIQDIARLATERAAFTVPDASAIPIGFRHGAVPWHLLEATHVNFFTQQSLHRALQPYFSKIEFGRIGLSHFGDSPYYVSLAAVCLK